jgi:hypothetical protein
MNISYIQKLLKRKSSESTFFTFFSENYFRHLLIFTSLYFLLGVFVKAQVPQGFNYQAVIRTSDGELRANESVTLEIKLLQGSEDGVTAYSETHSTQTNNFGMVNLQVGSQSPALFEDINWSAGPFYVRVSIDDIEMGTSPLMSVPFAMHSSTSNSVSNNSVTTEKIANGAITPEKISQSGATTGQVIKWNGSTWMPGDDESGEGGFTLPYEGSSTNSTIAFSISGEYTGILGVSLNPFDSEFNIGVHGKSLMNQWSRGVFGEGIFAGLWGESANYGVYGDGGIGVYGRSSNSLGTAIWGYSSSTTGTTYGVRSEVRSNSGFSGHFKGGKFYVDGKVGLGTESPVTSLHVRHGVLATNAPEPVEGIRIHNSGANNNSWTLYTVNSNGNLQLYANNTLRGTFSSTNGVFTSSSNRRLKTDIAALEEDILNRTMLLQPVSYRFISHPDQPPTIGFIAEDVQPLFPELVETTGETDEDLGVNYAAFSVVAIKAIQQQQKQMEALQAENDQLKKRLERLEQIVAATAGK